MATRQEVILKGLTHSPSDYDCQDGELATCLNLINEDGALHSIGHRQIVFIDLPNPAPIFMDRRKVFEEELRKTGITDTKRFVYTMTFKDKNTGGHVGNVQAPTIILQQTRRGGLDVGVYMSAIIWPI